MKDGAHVFCDNDQTFGFIKTRHHAPFAHKQSYLANPRQGNGDFVCLHKVVDDIQVLS